VNTKRVIQYFASIAAVSGKKDASQEKKVCLILFIKEEGQTQFWRLNFDSSCIHRAPWRIKSSRLIRLWRLLEMPRPSETTTHPDL